MKSRPLRLVVLGLSLSSSWGNGHATTYRALLRALALRGHSILFLERDQPWYAEQRDLARPDFCELRFYRKLSELQQFRAEITAADMVVVGSYVPDGIKVAHYVLETARGLTAFYDIDTPVTLAALAKGSCAYLAAELIPSFDLYLSFTGGPVLKHLETVHGAVAARALHCSVDAGLCRRNPQRMRWHLGYLGTYSADRQPMLERLLIRPARKLPQKRFVVAGSLYPPGIKWPKNVERIEHLPPVEHAAFFASLGWTLNVTRADMVRLGHSPSVRLFEAAARATPILSDEWPGLDRFFRIGEEIMTAAAPADVVRAIRMRSAVRAKLGAAGLARVLSEHTADHRAGALEGFIEEAQARRRAPDIAPIGVKAVRPAPPSAIAAVGAAPGRR
jgi:spore maturation protein CgeB